MHCSMKQTAAGEPERSAFRAAEKLYKRPEPKRRRRRRKDSTPAAAAPGGDPAQIFDFRAPDSIRTLVRYPAPATDAAACQPIYGLSTHPGFFFAPGAVSPEEQHSFLRDIANLLLTPPATTNHTAAHGPLPGLWRAAEQGLRLRAADQQLQPGALPDEHSAAAPQQLHSRPLAAATAPATGSSGPAADGTAAGEGGLAPRQQVSDSSGCAADSGATWSADGCGKPAAQLLRKLRWLTVGPRYDWTLRKYDLDGRHHKLPSYAAALAQRLVAAAELAAAAGDVSAAGRVRAGTAQPAPPQHAAVSKERRQLEPQASPDFQPDAALVCFYREGETLCGHQDDVERDISQNLSAAPMHPAGLLQPIVSLSLGCTAILLLGGRTRDEAPTAMYVRHGDIVVFTGPARMFYHGVPRVFDDGPASLKRAGNDRALTPAMREFVRHSRINISIRRVS